MNLLDIIYPQPCIYCGRYVRTGAYGLCPGCFGLLKPSLKNHNNTWFVFDYDKRIAAVLKSAKYGGKPYYIRKIAELAGDLMKEAGLFYDMVLYVPMDRRSIGARGYNQSRLAAKAISHRMGCRFYEGIIRKTRCNERQAGLSGAERKQNVKGVYEARDGSAAGKRVLIVDDIMTTGSTLDECTRVLYASGAVEVERAVIAFTPLRYEQ